MIPRPPRSTRTDTLFPYTTLFRSIVHTMLAQRALKSGFDVRPISLLAPAVRIDTFDKELGAVVASRGIRLLSANLTDAGERAASSGDRERDVWGKSVSVHVAVGDRGIHIETNQRNTTNNQTTTT